MVPFSNSEWLQLDRLTVRPAGPTHPIGYAYWLSVSVVQKAPICNFSQEMITIEEYMHYNTVDQLISVVVPYIILQSSTILHCLRKLFHDRSIVLPPLLLRSAFSHINYPCLILIIFPNLTKSLVTIKLSILLNYLVTIFSYFPS